MNIKKMEMLKNYLTIPKIQFKKLLKKYEQTNNKNRQTVGQKHN